MKKKLKSLKPVCYLPASGKPAGQSGALIIKMPGHHAASGRHPLRAISQHDSISSGKAWYDKVFAELFDLPDTEKEFRRHESLYLNTMISVQARSSGVYKINNNY